MVEGAHFEKRQLWKDPKHKQVLVGNIARPTKCAWCERHCEWQRQLDIEHYRPKAEVTRWDGSPPLVSDHPPKQVRVSDGYWWLAFDWDNYLRLSITYQSGMADERGGVRCKASRGVRRAVRVRVGGAERDRSVSALDRAT